MCVSYFIKQFLDFIIGHMGFTHSFVTNKCILKIILKISIALKTLISFATSFNNLLNKNLKIGLLNIPPHFHQSESFSGKIPFLLFQEKIIR